MNGPVDIIEGGGVLSSASAYNLVGVDETGTLANGVNGNLVGVTNARLGTLCDFGGSTETIRLLSGSPAIDAGSNALAVDPTTGQPLAYDQRGTSFPRIVNGTVDIGAYESPIITSSIPTVYRVNTSSDNGPTPAGSGSGTTGDLRYVINQANANTNLAGSVLMLDPAVFATLQTITLSPSLGTLALDAPTGEMIQGPGAGLVTISGGSAVGVLRVDTGVTATLSGLTVSGGYVQNGNGGGVDSLGLLTVNNCTIDDNWAAGNGGGIDSGG
jgi:hypothetical protein